MPLTPLRKGDPTRLGDFRLSARLGAGGMGIVYLGSDRAGRPVAVKVIRGEFAADPAFRARFRREVRAAATVDGVFAARLLAADPEAGVPWLATEYVAGPSLAEVVAAEGRLEPTLLRVLAVGLAEALASIHGAGVVHRDLKPGNVLLTATGPKVIDFGIASAADATVSTRTGVGVGSPGYMSPEQVTGEYRVGPASDVFAWAATVLYAASGQPPFGVGRPEVVLYRIVHGEVDISAVLEDLQPAVTRALSRVPDQRPTAAELTRLLLPDQLDPADVTRHITDQNWRSLTSRTPMHDAGQLRGAHCRRPLALGGALLAVAAALAAALVLAPSGNSSSPPVATRSSPPAATSSAEPPNEPALAATSPSSRAEVPQYRGELGNLDKAQPFVEFIDNHDSQVVFLDVETTIDAGYDFFHPGPDYGGDDRPNFTLFDYCGALAPGKIPGYEFEKECTGIVYRLTMSEGSEAFFELINGIYHVKGHYWVNVIPGTHQGFRAVTLRAVDVSDLVS